MAEYTAWLSLNYDSPCTLRSYATVASMFVKWSGERSPSSHETAKLYVEAMIKEKVNSATIMQRKHALITFFRFLEEKGYAKDGSSVKIIRVKIPKSLKHPPTIMPEEVYSKLIGSTDDLTDLAQLMLTWDCALRVQELMELEVDDLTAQEECLRVKVAKRTEGYEYAFTPIEIETLVAVRKYLKRCGIKAGLIFPSPMTMERPKSMLRRLCFRTGLRPGNKPYYNYHSIRHGRAMERYRSSNYNLEFVRKWLRHQSIESTKIYAMMESSDLVAISKAIDKKKRGIVPAAAPKSKKSVLHGDYVQEDDDDDEEDE
jgi:integrase